MDAHEAIRSTYYIVAILGVLISGLAGLIWRHAVLAGRVSAVEHSAKTNADTLLRFSPNQETNARIDERMRAIENSMKALDERLERDMRSMGAKIDAQGAMINQQAVNLAALAGRLEGAAVRLLEVMQEKGPHGKGPR